MCGIPSHCSVTGSEERDKQASSVRQSENPHQGHGKRKEATTEIHFTSGHSSTNPCTSCALKKGDLDQNKIPEFWPIRQRNYQNVALIRSYSSVVYSESAGPIPVTLALIHRSNGAKY
ncbi:hypothetical protein RRG08_019736 [Elysia crispata]|uniref:Uncharacterized protein n=1 Tax=Elysia crispata TaxID=231223 RepID=A0AAE0Y8T1_9GAST|nr:hypothetical protein RRG08_019736 [Elysia crispata]